MKLNVDLDLVDNGLVVHGLVDHGLVNRGFGRLSNAVCGLVDRESVSRSCTVRCWIYTSWITRW